MQYQIQENFWKCLRHSYFEIIDFKVYAYIRRLKYNNAIEIANNIYRANQLHTIIRAG